MPTPRDVVYNCLIHYPTLFATKGDVYKHIFLDIGNGFEWNVYGEIESVYGSEKESAYVDINEMQFLQEDSTFIRGQKKLRALRTNNLIDFNKKHFDLVFEEPVKLGSIQYDTISVEYSLLFRVPDNATPDWLQACEETSRALNFRLHLDRQLETSRLGTSQAIAVANENLRRKHWARQDAVMWGIVNDLLRNKD